MAASLQRIEVRGFESIRECALDLRQLTVLIGGNGSGKSNLVQVFGLLHEVVAGRLQAFVARQGLQPNLPATVLLDEPELGLHPYALQVLAGLLRAASHKTQVIVSTQSVTLVNQFEPADIVVVERSGGASTFRHANEPEVSTWLDDYGLGDLWEKNVLGGRPSA